MLTSLVERAPGARGAIFCDYEGESVALAVRDAALPEYDLKVFGAQLAAVWLTLRTDASEGGGGTVAELRVGCASGTLLCRSLPDGYYVALLVAAGAPPSPAAYALRATAKELATAL
jgi:hypothetical protein